VECQEKRAICEVWPADDILDAIEKNRARRLKRHLACVRVELAQPEARTRGVLDLDIEWPISRGVTARADRPAPLSRTLTRAYA
jgi:hypothetical protein